jgi:hypothetical protein
VAEPWGGEEREDGRWIGRMTTGDVAPWHHLVALVLGLQYTQELRRGELTPRPSPRPPAPRVCTRCWSEKVLIYWVREVFFFEIKRS